QLGIAADVVFAGTSSSGEVQQSIAAASALVLPSRFDGWGLVINEALMAGVPVIVSNACGAAELVQDGVHGFVFSSGDSASLATKMASLLRSEPAAMRRSAAALG